MQRIVCVFGMVGLLVAHTWAFGQQENRKQLAASGWGALTGVATYDGTPPPAKSLVDILATSTEKDFFLKSPVAAMLDPTWVVNKENKGVANVVIWLESPKGTYFPIPEKDKVRKDTVSLDQPHCAYAPHVFTSFPRYFSGNEYVKTGQVFKLTNTSPINHCPTWRGNPRTANNGNIILKPGTEYVVELEPQKTPIVFDCPIRPWQKAYGWVFDHPYATVSKEDGSFQIPEVPAGAELTVHAWHEAVGYLVKGKLGETTQFKEGMNQFDVKVKR